VRFITDYRKLNENIIRKPWPIPHIMDLIHDIGTYTYVTALDLSMGYYHLKLSPQLSEMSTFMLDIGCYKYLRLPMGLSVSVDIFQRLMNSLFADLQFVHTYLDDILIVSDGSYEDHMEKVAIVLERMAKNGLQINARKSYWAVKTVEYLGYILTPRGVRPQPRKISAIMELDAPKTKRQLRHFIGMVNYYRFMWK
jgi:hypothetical protein